MQAVDAQGSVHRLAGRPEALSKKLAAKQPGVQVALGDRHPLEEVRLRRNSRRFSNPFNESRGAGAVVLSSFISPIV